MDHQQDLFTDLPRGEQLAALRKIKLDSYQHRDRSVSGAICKSVLRAIDDRAGARGCFASQSTIADEVGCGVATVSRAIAALVAQDLVTIEKANPWAPNTHFINWTAVFQSVLGSDGHRQEQTLPTANSVLAVGQDRDSLRPRPSAPQARQIAPLIANLNAPTNRPANWEAVVAELFRWGLKTSAGAVDAARANGMTIELVRELWIECGGHREPQRWEPGQLANWLTGKTVPPFDHDEALRRIDEREHAGDRRDQAAAESIRQSVIHSGRIQQAESWVTAGITFRKLTAAGLERFATADEREAGDRMDAIDRQRSAEQSEPEKRALHVDARSVGKPFATDEAGKPLDSLHVNVRLRGVPGTGMNQRRREIERALMLIE